MRPGRQPVTASAQSTMPISARSSSGYAMLVVTAARDEPPSVPRIAGKMIAVPTAPTARPLITPSNQRLERRSFTRERSSSTIATYAGG